ncbi:MAG TPA: ATPase, T2SS/T4P/T4SS family, partial [Dermatophilaceae bacterium]|nr:ATPase, T2SS/T4P/T4SS family [Dermatophilaceae bacterium]
AQTGVPAGPSRRRDSALRGIVSALLDRGLSREAFRAAADTAELTGRPLQSVLVEDRVVTEFEMASAVADAYGLDSLDLANCPLDPSAMDRVPLALARRHRMLPIALNDNVLTVAVADPGNVMGLDDIRSATGLIIRPVVASSGELTKLLDRYTRESTDLEDAATQVVTDQGAAVTESLAASNHDTPIVRFVNSLLERAVSARASDIHLEPSESSMRIRLRIDGVLHEVDSVPRGLQSALISRLKIMSGLDITERRVPQNGRMTMNVGSRSIDLRAATLPTVWGEKVVLRILDTGGLDLDLKLLGFTSFNYDRFEASFTKPHGMVLVTGPTGSGKSTTLYATLTKISSPEVNVITVEDPVEYRVAGVNQVQVNPKAGLTFAAVLPAILRSDPDVVLIGEIRDRPTAQLAIEAALTGHLVLSTLHTNDAPSTMTRLVEMGIEPFLVGSSLDCVLAQRLARRLCTWCRRPYHPTHEELQAARWPFQVLGEPGELWLAVGCRSCADTGFRGRLALTEVMPVTEEIARLTVVQAPPNEVAKVALAEGMVSLRDDGLRKAAAGTTTVQEVVRVTI